MASCVLTTSSKPRPKTDRARSRSPISAMRSASSASTRRRAAKGSNPSPAAMSGSRIRPTATSLRVSLARQRQARLSQSVRIAEPRVAHEPVSRSRGSRGRVARRRSRRGLLAICRARSRATSAWRSPPATKRRRARNAEHWAKLFPNAFLHRIAALPVSRAAETYMQQAVALAAKLKLPVVATHPLQFMTPDDFTAHEARVCISEGDILANPRRQKRFTTEQYFRTQDEMCALFADIPSAAREYRRDREALQSDARTRQAEAAAVPDARRHVARRLPRAVVEGRAGSAPRAAVSRRSRA